MTRFAYQSLRIVLCLGLLTGVFLDGHVLLAADPDPARFEKEIASFEAADQANPPASGQILFVGSSSIRLWKLADSFPQLDALNRGFGGSIIADSVHFFPRIVQPYRPRQVVFYAGDNDIASKRSPETVHQDFMQFVGLMHKHLPGTPLAFISIKPSIKRWSLIEHVRAANALIKAECEKDPLLTYVDVDGPMLNGAGEPRPELFVQDGLHMTPAGYAVWTDLLLPHLKLDQRSTRLRTLNDSYHPWTPPQTLPEWEEEAARIRLRVQVATGLWPMPAKGDLQPVVHGIVDRGDYTIERVFFASMPGHYVTGSLYRPKNLSGKAPAVLCPYGHWENGRFMQHSAEEANRQKTMGAEKFQSGAVYPVQARMVGLVRMGCIVFNYDMVGVADSSPLEHRGGFSDADSALWLHNKMGLQTWNSIRAVDFVASLPDVDTTRIGVTGASGGGTQTFMLGALDPRVTTAFPAVMVGTAMQGGCICENADYLRIGINNVAIAALFAPRPMAMSGANDWTINIETKGLPELKHVYSLYGKGDLVDAKAFPQFPHNYNQVAREMMYRWFHTHLQTEEGRRVDQSDFWPLTIEEMTVYTKDHPVPADALKEPELRAKLRERDQATFDRLLKGDRAEFEKVLRGAQEILLPPVGPDVRVVELKTAGAETDKPWKVSRSLIEYDQARVPLTVISSTKIPASGKVILWLDGAGAEHLWTASGELSAAMQNLLDQGIAVASAELLAVKESGRPNLYATRFQTASPSHKSSPGDPEYTGFVYGYNRPLLTERVRDIQAAVQGLNKLEFAQISLVGTGDAGLWTLLASAGLPAGLADSTTVHLNNFSFTGVKANGDANMLPGARKYGGVGGLASLAYPTTLNIFGAGPEALAELDALRQAYAGDTGKLQISEKALGHDEVLTLFLTQK